MASTLPVWLRLIADRVDQRLHRLLDAEEHRWTTLDPDLQLPLQELSRLVAAGGKRLRPAFCHWGFMGAGGEENSPQLLDAESALELLHASALFHDDVIDGSATRRGEPTAHTVFTKNHHDNQWTSEARRFGEGAAILIGDLAFIYADQLIMGATHKVWEIWNEMRIELNIGQYLDLLGSAQRERRSLKAERICRYKSGKYTIERPLHLGAMLAAPERADELLPALSKYGLPLGDVFQMRDDVLGAFGDGGENLTGKPVGDDLREGKPTPLLAIATRRATTTQRAVLDLVGSAAMNDATVAKVQAVIKETGALDELETNIAKLTDTAVDAIRTAPITQRAKDALIELAAFVAQRTI